MMRIHDATRIRAGWDVYGATGEKIGTVADASNNYIVIEKGFVFTTDMFVPMSAVAAVADERVELNLTKGQLEEGNFTSPIGDWWSHADSDTRFDSGFSRNAMSDSVVGDAAVIERSEERPTVEETLRREEFDIDADTPASRSTTRRP